MIEVHSNVVIVEGVNEISAKIHELNKTWWKFDEEGKPVSNKGERMMLMVSEISEAMEGARKNLMDDKLPHRTMEEVELADLLVRAFDYAGAFGLDLDGALSEKLQYNRVRADHKVENREKDGGKKW
jgi:hypothetical protein